jgi:hypothetical protein
MIALLLGLSGSVSAQEDLSRELAVGSWFGRAVPNNPSTAPFPEVVMTPTFFADGTLIANDSQEETSPHATSHGHWTRTGPNRLKAVFVWMNLATPEDSIPNGYTGAIKVTLLGTINPANPDEMTGTVNPRFFPPGTDPLDSTNTGSIDLGVFTITQLSRIKAEPSDPTVVGRNLNGELAVGSWFGRALPDNPSTSPFPEVVMTPTFFADGNFIANDSQEGNAPHTTTHGDWVRTGDNQLKAVLIWMNLAAPEDSVPSGFTGAVKVTLLGTIDPANPDEMTGTLSVLFFPPGTDPLDPANTGSVDFGSFTIAELARIKPEPSGLTVIGRDLGAELAVGSWFGRAVPNNPSTSPFPEVVMTPTFFADGNFVANDSHEETSPHATVHGGWTRTGAHKAKAVFVWMNLAAPADSVPNGYTGAVKATLLGTIDPANPDEMAGTLSVHFFPPGTDPLDPANTGGIDLGTFTIARLTRIKAQPSAPTVVSEDVSEELAVGSWFGRAVTNSPATSPFPEIVISPTFFADGTLIVNDSQEGNTLHGTSHGHWIKTGINRFRAAFVVLSLATPADSIPSGYKGSLKFILEGAINPSSPDAMTGTVAVLSFPPDADPLDPMNTGSTNFGSFTIIEMKRIKAEPSLPTVASRNLSAERAVGSWFGRAVPDNPSTAPFPEVVMTPTFFADGTFVANDSHEKTSPHATVHGEWVRTGDDSVKAVFVWINLAAPADSVPSGYTGAVKATLLGTIDPANPDEMTGTLNPFFFPPGTDPLDPANTGGVDLGVFTIAQLTRIKAQPSAPTVVSQALNEERAIGSWFGRAVPDNPSTSPFPEVVMTPTFFANGMLVANDSHEETNPHATSHGQWTRTGPNELKGVFVWMNLAAPADSVPNGYTGAFKVTLLGTIDPANPNAMTGTVNPLFFPPGTDPLDSTNTGGIDLGTFTIVELARISGDPSGVTAIFEGQDTAARPRQYALENAFPNPFNPTTTIRYTLARDSQVRLVVYNILGQQVRVLVEGLQLTGLHWVTWDGRGDNGQRVGSGIYLYRITAGEFSQSRKMLLLK